MSTIADRLTEVRMRIERAARSAGRDPASVTLVAVSKTFSVSAVREAYAAGQRVFGENRVQEALDKIGALPDLSIRWHLLGHLQSNKARKAAVFATIQSVDTVDLLRRIDAAAVESGHAPEVLIQVDLAGESTKFGVAPADVPRLFEAAADCRAAQLAGLMTLPPAPDIPEDARPWFRQLRELRDGWVSSGVPATMLRELSMGMSGDFEVAVEEGATLVRVGTAIFGERHVED
jgi:PLP dependent protein